MSFTERNAIANPAEGLIIFCTNCGLNGTGALSIYTAGEWFTFHICRTNTPSAAVITVNHYSIIWRWRSVLGAVGYKWSTQNNYDSAVDVGLDTIKEELEMNCGTNYSRYVWAYSDCGLSTPLQLNNTTLSCWECGDTVYVNHVAGNVAPVNKSTAYGTVNNVAGETSKCWITSNLGSDHQASGKLDATEASAGWYWQFNRMRGYKHDGITRTPASTWISSIDEFSNWLIENDPCEIEIGDGWRIPTYFELYNVDTEGGWNNIDDTWNSLLKIHAAGRLQASTGALGNRGVDGNLWSNTQGNTTSGHRLQAYSNYCSMNTFAKAFALSIRCIKEQTQ